MAKPPQDLGVRLQTLLDKLTALRQELLRQGYHLTDIDVGASSTSGITATVENTTTYRSSDEKAIERLGVEEAEYYGWNDMEVECG